MSEAVARRYARAVFELGKETGRLAALRSEIEAFAEVHAGSPDFCEMARSPLLGDDTRGRIVEQIGQRLGASREIIQLVRLLVRRGRLDVLPRIVACYAEMLDEHEGVLRATVRSAGPLSEEYLARLQSKIERATGRKVAVAFERDPSLIGGVVTQIGDRVVDGTVRGRLDQLARSVRQT